MVQETERIDFRNCKYEKCLSFQELNSRNLKRENSENLKAKKTKRLSKAFKN